MGKLAVLLLIWCGELVTSVAFLLLAEVADAQYAVPSGIPNWWTGDTDGTDRVGAKTIVAQNGATTATGYTLNGFKMGGGSQHWLTSHNSWSLGSTFTIEFWAKLDTTSTQQAFVAADEGPGTTNKWILRYRTSPSRLNFHINGPVVGSHNFEASWSPTAGTWYHICVLRDGTNYKIFVDNTQLGSSTAGPAPPTVSYGLSIGMAENNMYMQGMVDELSVYNRAISHGSGGELSGIFNARQLGKRKFWCEYLVESVD
eukprot:jgi/Bigna1/75964/fgenesh1_pg.38_\